MKRLDEFTLVACSTIQGSMSIDDYVRFLQPDDPEGPWRGDECGCPDDRCIGHHHEPGEQCGCLLAMIGQIRTTDGWLRRWGAPRSGTR